MKLADAITIIVLALTVAGMAIAQQQPTPEQALAAKIADQRNAAQNEAAVCYASTVDLQRKLEAAQTELAKLKPKEELKK